MRQQFQSVFAIEPTRVLQDLSVPWTKEQDLVWVQHATQPDQRMLLSQGVFVSETPDCPLLACSLFDYVRFRLGSADLAMQFFHRTYGHQVKLPSGHSLDALLPALQRQCLEDRQQFDRLLQLRQSTLQNPPLSGLLWCHQHRINPATARHGSFFLVKEDQLTGLIDTKELSKLKSEEFVIFPYWADPCTLAWLRVGSTQHEAPWITIPVREVRHAYFGLTTWRPFTRECRLYDGEIAAQMACTVEWAHARQDVAFIHVAVNLEHPVNPYRLPPSVFLAKPDTNLNYLTQVRLNLDQLVMVEDSVGDPSFGSVLTRGVSWSDYIINRASGILRTQGEDAPQLLALVDLIRADVQLCQRLLLVLTKTRSFRAINILNRHLNSLQSWTLGGILVEETVNGYVAKRKNQTVQFTNFRIRLDSNVLFEDEDPIMVHFGTLIMGEVQTPVALQSKTISHHPDDIPAACLSALVNHGLQKRIAEIPQILDSTLSKRLGELLKHQARSNPPKTGVWKLGWTNDRSRFVAPTWEVGQQGSQVTSGIGYPYSDYLRNYYTFTPPVVAANEDTGNNNWRCLLSLMASGLARAALQFSVPPVEIKRTPNAQQMLELLFSLFGQHQPVLFGSQRRTAMNYLSATNVSGYPVYGCASVFGLVSGTRNPVFLLSDTGLCFGEPFDPSQGPSWLSVAQAVLQAVLHYCLTQPLQMHEWIGSEDEPEISAMILEGQSLIQRVTHRPRWPVFQEHLTLFSLALTTVTPEEASRQLRYDLSTERVYLPAHWNQHFNGALLQELTLACPDTQAHANGELSLPVNVAWRWLQEYYGQDVKPLQTPRPTSSASPVNAVTPVPAPSVT